MADKVIEHCQLEEILTTEVKQVNNLHLILAMVFTIVCCHWSQVKYRWMCVCPDI